MTSSTLDERYVAQTLGITRARAKALLKRHANDAEVAIEAYRQASSTLPTPKKPDKPDEIKNDPETEDNEAHAPLSELPQSKAAHVAEPASKNGEHVNGPQSDLTVAHFTGLDFVMPRLVAPATLTNGGEDGSGKFVLGDVIAAIQDGESAARVHNYLAFYSSSAIQANINGHVKGVPAMFYVVQSRNLAMIRLWAKYGGDVNATADFQPLVGVPLLAFAAGLGGSFKYDASEIVTTLLSLGALPGSIPQAFFSPFQRDLPDDGPPVSEMPEVTESRMAWCIEDVRKMLAIRLNLRQRYYLNMASLLSSPGVRARQVTALTDADSLLGVPFFLVGQTPASQFLIKRLLRLLARPSKVPAVMVFAGPSGHGKTELARKLGELLSLDMEIVDCTSKQDEREMFGARNPWQGWEKGSPLNNFLVRKMGHRCIAFLDEFEKTTKEVHQTLLLPFQSGEYEDRKTRATIDSSKTIWILATNTFDDTIHDFCKRHETVLCHSSDQVAVQKLVKGLCKTLRTESIEKFGAPLTGRITDFIPFLTFSEGEQACVAHKYLTEVGKEMAKPIVVSRDKKEQRFVGNVDLQVRKDYSICRIIAQEEYLVQLGARSVISGVSRLVEDEVLDHFLDIDEEIAEDQGVTTYRVEPNRDDEIEVCFVGRAVHVKSESTASVKGSLRNGQDAEEAHTSDSESGWELSTM